MFIAAVSTICLLMHLALLFEAKLLIMVAAFIEQQQFIDNIKPWDSIISNHANLKKITKTTN